MEGAWVKRSDAEKSFELVIKDYFKGYKIPNGVIPRELADRILTLALNIGMKPPLPEKECYPIEVIEACLTFEWEPEDETTQTSNS